VPSSTKSLPLVTCLQYVLLSSSRLNFSHRFGMVYYNNLLSAALIFPFCVMRGEFEAFLDPTVMTSEFIFWNCVAGFLGFFLNFASLWCVSSTSATTYAVIGKVIARIYFFISICCIQLTLILITSLLICLHRISQQNSDYFSRFCGLSCEDD
jgi:hypothetical protein